jgi:simple sugar transport system permease protein
MIDPGVLLMGTVTLSAPLVLAAMGGLCSERSGIINIGLEGKMLIACATTAVVSLKLGNPAIGLISGIVAAILFSLLHLLLTQTYRIDQIVSGMAINVLAYGASNVLDRTLISTQESSRFPTFPDGVYLAIAFLTPVVLYFYLYRTKGGLRLRAVGESPDKSRQMGVSTQQVRALALVATGVFCGLAGALVVSSAGSFVDQMTAGRGFIALAALILGGWRPIPALIACVVFGFFDSLQIQLQGTAMAGAKLPPEFWKALPYMATLAALTGFLGRNRAPSGLGKA